MIHAEITVKIDTFIDALDAINKAQTPVYSSATLSLQTLPGNIKPQAKPNAFYVWGKVEIDFIFPAAAGFMPIGITFVRIPGGGLSDPLGVKNMPRAKIKTFKNPKKDGVLQIVDDWQDYGSPGVWAWKFSVMFQDADGKLGILDPEISNTDIEPFTPKG